MLTQAASIVIATTTVLGVLAFVAVGLRLYCRRLQQLPMGGDDYCVILALILSTGISIACDYAAAITGVGDPSYEPSSRALVLAMKTTFAMEDVQLAALAFAKVSLLLFYRRIFIMDWFLRYNTAVILIITSYTVAFILVMTFSKWPVSEQWNFETPYNVNTAAVLISFVALSFTFDLITLAMPLLAVKGLAMDKQRKVFLSTMFSFGSLCTIASICRLYYAVQYAYSNQTPSSLFQAPFIYNDLWALIEPPAFIITGCLITFGPFYHSIKNRARSSGFLRNRHTQHLDQQIAEANIGMHIRKHSTPVQLSELKLGETYHDWRGKI